MKPARGFTIIDLLVLLLAIVVLVALLLPALGSSRHSPQLKDSTQVRGIHMAMVVWAQSNADTYPLPSLLDKLNTTVPEIGRAKDTTANIYSIMLFNGSLSPEILVSPMEVNSHIRVCDGYQETKPKGALDPAKALWDPAFAACLDGSKPGNTSYAHLQPSGARLDRWANWFVQTDMILAMRAPEIKGVQKNPDGSITPTLANPKSKTLRLFGRGKSWSGNTAFNDNHVEFLKNWLVPGKRIPPSRGPTYKATDGKQWSDLWCYDEPDDPKATNDYLGIFLKAGDTPADFKAAWD